MFIAGMKPSDIFANTKLKYNIAYRKIYCCESTCNFSRNLS